MNVVRLSFSTTLLFRQRFSVCLSFVPSYFKPAGQIIHRPESRNGDYAHYSNTFCWWVQPRSLMSLWTILLLHVKALMSSMVWTIWSLLTKGSMHCCMLLLVCFGRRWWRWSFEAGCPHVSIGAASQ
jgi:hypothetical protein